jgi:hypothetical protein
VSEAQRSPKEKDLSNPWNRFQRENRGKACLKRHWPKFTNMNRRSTTRTTKP